MNRTDLDKLATQEANHLLAGDGYDIPVTKKTEFYHIFPVLTLAGVAWHWRKARSQVEMAILKDQIDAYKDGAIWMILTRSVVAHWGNPTRFEGRDTE